MRVDSPYPPGARSRAWIKTPLRSTQEVVIGGWTSREGRREGTIGSLLLGVYDDQHRLTSAGHVGTGFSERTLGELQTRLERLERDSPPFDVPVPLEYTRRATGSNQRWSARWRTASGPTTADYDTRPGAAATRPRTGRPAAHRGRVSPLGVSLIAARCASIEHFFY